MFHARLLNFHSAINRKKFRHLIDFFATLGTKNLPNVTENEESPASLDRNKPTSSGLGGKYLTGEIRDWWKNQFDHHDLHVD